MAVAHGVYNMAWNILGKDLTAVNDPNAVEYVGGESGILVVALLVIAAPILITATRRLSLSTAPKAV